VTIEQIIKTIVSYIEIGSGIGVEIKEKTDKIICCICRFSIKYKKVGDSVSFLLKQKMISDL
jgi:hypothetical protein